MFQGCFLSSKGSFVWASLCSTHFMFVSGRHAINRNWLRYLCSKDVCRFKGVLLCSKEGYYVQRGNIVQFQCSDSCMLFATIGISYVQMTFSKSKGTFLRSKGNSYVQRGIITFPCASTHACLLLERLGTVQKPWQNAKFPALCQKCTLPNHFPTKRLHESGGLKSPASSELRFVYAKWLETILKKWIVFSIILKDILDVLKGYSETVWKHLKIVCDIYVPRMFLKFKGIFCVSRFMFNLFLFHFLWPGPRKPRFQ